MKRSELKYHIIKSLEGDNDPVESARILEQAGVTYKFRDGFTELVVKKICDSKPATYYEFYSFYGLDRILYRIALTGIAAIIIMIISILIGQGSISADSFLGLGNTYDESIICLITGN